jgi:CheY-like chemotaxis protein
MSVALEVKTVFASGAAALREYASLRALVVDDDHCLVTIVHQMLEVLGFSVDTANGGLAAMRCLSQFRYDLMVTDLQMPDMDGYSLSGWLKHKSRDTKVIVMTGRNPADVVGYMKSGIVDRWLFKPFSFSKLRGLLGDLIPTESLSCFARQIGHHGSAPDDCQPRVAQRASLKEA